MNVSWALLPCAGWEEVHFKIFLLPPDANCKDGQFHHLGSDPECSSNPS